MVCLLSEGFGLKEVIALLRGISFDFLVHLVRAGRLDLDSILISFKMNFVQVII